MLVPHASLCCRWQNLAVLDVIKARNRAKEAEKMKVEVVASPNPYSFVSHGQPAAVLVTPSPESCPESSPEWKAPFFLPMLPGLEPQFAPAPAEEGKSGVSEDAADGDGGTLCTAHCVMIQ